LNYLLTIKREVQIEGNSPYAKVSVESSLRSLQLYLA